MLASRIAFTDQTYSASRTANMPARSSARNLASRANKELSYAEPESATVIKVRGGDDWDRRTGSQERIIEPDLSNSEAGIDEMKHRSGINKTIDFEMQESYSQPR